MVALWHHSLELAVQFLTLFAFFAAVVLPAAWVCFRRLSDLSVAARLGMGAAIGFALFVLAAWYIGLASLDYLLVFWLAQFPIAGLLGRMPKPAVSDRRQIRHSDSAQQQWDGESSTSNACRKLSPSVDTPSASPHRTYRHQWPVVFPLLAGVIVQLYGLQFSILPQGVDASFHCVVAQRQLDAGMVTNTLWPLEDLKLNYPVGSHLWLAVAAKWTGLAIHEVFRHSFAIVLCASALIIAAWAERLYGTAFHGAAASLAFMFCSIHASLFPYTWGGLPSQMAMWLGMAAIFCVVHLSGTVGLAAGALLFAATAMVHHHTMVALLGGTGIIAVLGGIMSQRHRLLCRRLLLSLAAATALAVIYVVPLVTRFSEVGKTGILTYSEPFGWPWDHLWSWPTESIARALTFANAGITVLSLVLGLKIQLKSDARAARTLLLALAACWLIGFCTLDYGSRLVAYCMGRPLGQPFTPSRFLFDAQFVLAILAGGGLVRIWEWLRRPAFRYALVSLLGCGAIVQTAPRWEPFLDDLLIPLGKWADSNLPANALVTGTRGVWVTYIFHRESTSLFIPISEPVAPQRTRLKDMLANRSSSQTWHQWRQRLGKPIYVVGLVDNEKGPPLFVSSPFAIYDMNPER
jgi:hypothetical protein